MKRFLLDSNALSQYVYKHSAVYKHALGVRLAGARVGTGMPVVAEFLAGTSFSDTWEINLPRAENMLRKIRVWPFEIAAARTYARLYAELRRNGIRMQPIDLMIAAIAFTLPNCTVVTCDSDFSRVPGLKIENWE